MANEETPLVQLRNAGYRQGGRWLVRGVDLEVGRGRIVTLIGPNGSGKSTTARMALGLICPHEGEAMRSDRIVVGYVPQRLSVDWTLPLDVRRFMVLTGRRDNRAVERAMSATGIRHLQRAQLATLSGGELQRVMLARAMACAPDLLVLDEPVQGVDYSGELAMYELIAQVRAETRCGILMISHDLHVVMAATDHVICLNGHVCCEGAPGQIAESPEYRRIFGERGEAALAVYRHHHDHVHLPDGRVRHGDGALPGQGEPERGTSESAGAAGGGHA